MLADDRLVLGYTNAMQASFAYPRARSGFTLLEVLAAMSVLTVSIAGAAFLMTSAYGTYRHQDRSLEVHRVVHDQMETLTATPYEALKADIQQARGPQDPPRSPSNQDFESLGGGEAVARYDLDPPADPDGDWQPKPKAQSTSGQLLINSATPDPNAMHATLDLQYWDPTFDVPAHDDRGLIRASYTLHGLGQDEHAVKYYTR
jgi:prepilin-type N-terminal cleavage/methylation domain-containing protein